MNNTLTIYVGSMVKAKQNEQQKISNNNNSGKNNGNLGTSTAFDSEPKWEAAGTPSIAGVKMHNFLELLTSVEKPLIGEYVRDDEFPTMSCVVVGRVPQTIAAADGDNSRNLYNLPSRRSSLYSGLNRTGAREMLREIAD